MSLNDSNVTKIQVQFRSLSKVAPALNSASDELNKAVSLLDEALKKLNIGLTVWVTFRNRGEDETDYDEDQIGYSKIDGKWGIALRRIWGDATRDIYHCDGPWLFDDGPRELRLLGVDKITDVIEALGNQASAMTKRVQDKAKEVRELAKVVGNIALENEPPEKILRESLATFGAAVKKASASITDPVAGPKQGSK
jgi:hypothetical protein